MLINKQDAIKLLRGKCVAKYPSTFIMGLFAAADEIAKLPGVEVAPVVHGRWMEERHQTLIPVEYDSSGNPVLHDITVYRCSQCGRTEGKKEPYCNCGAKMELEG